MSQDALMRHLRGLRVRQEVERDQQQAARAERHRDPLEPAEAAGERRADHNQGGQRHRSELGQADSSSTSLSDTWASSSVVVGLAAPIGSAWLPSAWHRGPCPCGHYALPGDAAVNHAAYYRHVAAP